jgi:hypothetical protein
LKSTNVTAVDDDRRAVDPAGLLETLQDRGVELLPDPGALPLLQSAVCRGR